MKIFGGALGVTSNFDLIKYAKIIGLPKLQVFSKDQLPKAKPGYYIINLIDSDSDIDVGHWVCCAIIKGHEHSYYADPFGTPFPTDIERFLKSVDKPIEASIVNLQALSSEMCGFFCLYILLGLHKRRRFIDILHDFDWDHPAKNDRFLRKFFLRYNIT